MHKLIRQLLIITALLYGFVSPAQLARGPQRRSAPRRQNARPGPSNSRPGMSEELPNAGVTEPLPAIQPGTARPMRPPAPPTTQFQGTPPRGSQNGRGGNALQGLFKRRARPGQDGTEGKKPQAPGDRRPQTQRPTFPNWRPGGVAPAPKPDAIKPSRPRPSQAPGTVPESIKPPRHPESGSRPTRPRPPSWRPRPGDTGASPPSKPAFRPPSRPPRSPSRGSLRRPAPVIKNYYYGSSRPWRPYWYRSYYFPQFPRVYYESWHVLQPQTYYPMPSLPEQFRLSATVGSRIEFELEEDVDSGYIWFASYDDYFCQVDIEHLRVPYEPPRYLQESNPLAAFQIEMFNPGDTMLELVYAKPLEYELGGEALKKIQVFMEISEAEEE